MSSFTKLYLMRVFRISLAVSIATAIWFLFNVERGYYIPMTLMLIYSPFEADLVNTRLKSRMLGTFLGILLAILILQLLSLNENLIVIMPLLVFICVYFLPLNYLYATIIITVGVFLMFGLIDTEGESFFSYGITRFVDTSIAAFICLIFETFLVPKVAIYKVMYNRTHDLLNIFHKRYNFLLSCFDEGNQQKDLSNNALIFSAKVEDLKNNIKINSYRFKKENDEQLTKCIETFTKLTKHYPTFIYLLNNQPQAVYQFKKKYHHLLQNLSPAFQNKDNLQELTNDLQTIATSKQNNKLSYYENILLNTINNICDRLKDIHITLDMLKQESH